MKSTLTLVLGAVLGLSAFGQQKQRKTAAVSSTTTTTTTTSQSSTSSTGVVGVQKLKTKKIGSTSASTSTTGTASATTTTAANTSTTTPEPEKSKWSAWLLYEISNLAGTAEGYDMKYDAAGYGLVNIGYDFGWKYNPSFRIQFGHTFSGEDKDGNEQEVFTMYDPYFHISGTTFKAGNFNISNYLRIYIPLSESSASSGKITELRFDTKLGYKINKKLSAYIGGTVYGRFYGYSKTDGEDDLNGTYGSFRFRAGLGGSITDKLGWNAELGAAALRKEGQSIGYLDYRERSENLSIELSYSIGESSLAAYWSKDFDEDANSSFAVYIWAPIF